MADMTKTVGVGRCRVCGKGTSLLPTHICPDCWAAGDPGMFQPADEPLDMDAGSGIEFVDELPADGRGNWDSAERATLRAFAAELKKHPGRWAKHPLPAPSNMAARSRASRINNGKVRAFGTGFTAVARNGDTYIRYDGVLRVSQLACPHNVPNFGPDCPICDR